MKLAVPHAGSMLKCTLVALQYTTLLPVQAAELPSLQEVVISSSRVEVPAVQNLSSVAVLNAEQLAAAGNLFLMDTLRRTPGVAVSSAGGVGKASSLRIRGEEGFRTLVLVDGIRLLDPAGPQISPQIEHLPSAGVARVEILRGPQGLGYGADAGGVLNISTRRPAAPAALHYEAGLGSFGTRQQSLAGGVEAGALELNLQAGRFASDGFNAQTSDIELADDDGYRNNTWHLRAGWELAPGLDLEWVQRRTMADAETDGCFGIEPGHDCRNFLDQQASRLALQYRGATLVHNFSVQHTLTEREHFAAGLSTLASEGELRRLEYLGHWDSPVGMELVLGADLEEAIHAGEGRINRGVWLEALTAPHPDVQLNAGLRHDTNEDFGSHLGYRLQAAWRKELEAGWSLRLRGSMGSGFRAPSPFELAWNRGEFASPPASDTVLQEERSRGRELALALIGPQGWQLELTGFVQHIENAIDFDLVGYSGYLQESGASSSKGLELQFAMPLSPQWTLGANLVHNDTQRPDGRQRLRRPALMANGYLDWRNPGGKLQLNIAARVARDSIDEDFAGVQALPDHAVVDLNLRWQLQPALSVSARLENAFDRRYQEILGYRSASRALYIGFRYSHALGRG